MIDRLNLGPSQAFSSSYVPVTTLPTLHHLMTLIGPYIALRAVLVVFRGVRGDHLRFDLLLLDDHA